MRNRLIAGNWKMNLDVEESIQLAAALADFFQRINSVDIAVIPPFTSIYPVNEILKSKESGIRIGAQNVYTETDGAYTGEISAEMLKSAGCSFVLIGHSERRNIFGETDKNVNNKVISSIAQSLPVILCVGETLEERDAGIYKEKVVSQTGAALNGISEEQLSDIVIAYEPVWAIGTGKNAKSSDAQEIHREIRSFIRNKYSSNASENIRIIYGGSVKPDNIGELISMEDIDGSLVGGASLKADSFEKIVENCL